MAVCLLANGQYKTYMVVAQDGSGDYSSIQSAINDTKSFPDKRITIFIKNGTYREKVKVYEWNTSLTIIGESKSGVIITWNDHFKSIEKGRNSTFLTPTLQVDANDFIGENLTIVNSAGPVGQAIALSVTADRCSLKNCDIKGNQDTLYISGENNRQYFKDCFIEGTTDFIFGNATAVFEDCEIHALANSYLTAASTEKNSNFGFIFINCELTASADMSSVYLGRPWRAYAQTVFIECDLAKQINEEGWKIWSNKGQEETTFYAEYKCTGDGSNTSNRVSWSHQLTKKQVKKYSLKNIFRDWEPLFNSFTTMKKG